ncbi:MAG TPA: peptidase C14 [Cyanothece sp. UBA12306]|nr:peptidase C14 [Cyanothece sp. UBA12306]
MDKARRAGINQIPLEIDYGGSRGLTIITSGSRPKGMAINIGLNRVDPHAYQGWDGRLNACENDAQAMAAIAQRRGFNSQLLLTENATVAAVRETIRKAALTLNTGDILLLTYSGHGSQVPDLNGDETDNLDETWVLYDRQMIDDELYSLFRQFKPGVRILLISDSCHSGTLARVPNFDSAASENSQVRTMPIEFRNRNYYAQQNLYQQIRRTTARVEENDVDASIILLAACQDNQLAYEAGKQGQFTQALLDTWNEGQFNQGYVRFHRDISQRMPTYQSPNYYKVGSPNLTFEQQIPFTIDPDAQREYVPISDSEVNQELNPIAPLLVMSV